MARQRLRRAQQEPAGQVSRRAQKGGFWRGCLARAHQNAHSDLTEEISESAAISVSNTSDPVKLLIPKVAAYDRLLVTPRKAPEEEADTIVDLDWPVVKVVGIDINRSVLEVEGSKWRASSGSSPWISTHSESVGGVIALSGYFTPCAASGSCPAWLSPPIRTDAMWSPRHQWQMTGLGSMPQPTIHVQNLSSGGRTTVPIGNPQAIAARWSCSLFARKMARRLRADQRTG